MSRPQREPNPNTDLATQRLRIFFQHLRTTLDSLEQLLLESSARPSVAPQPSAGAAPDTAMATKGPARADKFTYTIKEVCEKTGLGRSTVYQAIAYKKLRILKCGNQTLVRNTDLAEWIESWSVHE